MHALLEHYAALLFMCCFLY